MNSWKKFLLITLFTVLTCIVSYSFLFFIIDPFDRFHFNPHKDGQTIHLPERYLMPSLARKNYFDSVIVGTSVVMLLKPAVLNKLFDAKFVNLAMPSATAHEQIKLLDIFLRHHPTPKIIMIALDVVWKDDNSWGEWNDNFYFPKHFLKENLMEDITSSLSLKNAKYMLKKMDVQLWHPKKFFARPDGYMYFLLPAPLYSLQTARFHIYNQETPIAGRGFEGNILTQPSSTKKYGFKKAILLEQFLNKLPKETLKIFIFPPYHAYLQSKYNKGDQAEHWREFKRYYINLIKKYPNAYVVDFMIHSALTAKDENYWDELHYTEQVADDLCFMIYGAVARNKDFEFYKRY